MSLPSDHLIPPVLPKPKWMVGKPSEIDICLICKKLHIMKPLINYLFTIALVTGCVLLIERPAQARLAAQSPQTEFQIQHLFICQGTVDPSEGICSPNAASRQLTVVCWYSGAVPDQTTISVEWQLPDGTTVREQSLTLQKANGFFADLLTRRLQSGIYRAAVYVNNSYMQTASYTFREFQLAEADATEIRNLLDRWARALRQPDLRQYIACYAPVLEVYWRSRFTNISKSILERDMNIVSNSPIDVQIQDLRITGLREDRAIAEFAKSVQGGAHLPVGSGKARLTLVRTGIPPAWSIVGEEYPHGTESGPGR